MQMVRFFASALIAVLAACGGAGEELQKGFEQGRGEAKVSRDEYGDRWPLTVKQGVIECEDQAVTFVAPDGKRYAVNGVAKGRDIPPIDPIWAENPMVPGARRNIGPLIERGLEICR